ncbi:MAG: hypothetical protein DRJ26_04580 [Candidatus Methanomethylicota archaeon]|uniref:Aldehyde ferredoxin oxidoreductase C-terminal domain-containing protein n=1 Tax=Thermoproteota archaeon TaxID=2056631 RepID=A0A497EZT7_9CREN|nr:MAG: hypothetical protein DRJ26_04580 [Candidatus Verstraetearchaeota archaeon]
MVKEYYRLMGWDEKKGKPLRSTLQRLGLDFAINPKTLFYFSKI